MTRDEQITKLKKLSVMIETETGFSSDFKVEGLYKLPLFLCLSLQLPEHDNGYWCTNFTKVLNGIEYGFYIRLVEHTNRLNIGTKTIRSKVDDYYWSVDSINSFTSDFNKSNETIVKEIQRKILSHQDKFDAACLIAENHEKRVTDRLKRLKETCKVLGLRATEDELKRGSVTGYMSDNELYVKVKNYGEGFELEVNTLSLEQVQKIADVLNG